LCPSLKHSQVKQHPPVLLETTTNNRNELDVNADKRALKTRTLQVPPIFSHLYSVLKAV